MRSFCGDLNFPAFIAGRAEKSAPELDNTADKREDCAHHRNDPSPAIPMRLYSCLQENNKLRSIRGFAGIVVPAVTKSFFLLGVVDDLTSKFLVVFPFGVSFVSGLAHDYAPWAVRYAAASFRGFFRAIPDEATLRRRNLVVSV